MEGLADTTKYANEFEDKFPNDVKVKRRVDPTTENPGKNDDQDTPSKGDDGFAKANEIGGSDDGMAEFDALGTFDRNGN